MVNAAHLKTGLPSITSPATAGVGRHGPVPRCGLGDQTGLLTVGAPDDGTDGRHRARTDDGSAGPVGEDERARAVLVTVMSDNRSTPITSAYVDAPVRTSESASVEP